MALFKFTRSVNALVVAPLKPDRATQMGFLPAQQPLAEGGEVGQGREGPSEIPLCVGLESFCLCELYIKRSWTAAGSLKWRRGVSELNTGLCLDMFLFKTDSAAVEKQLS